MNSLKLAVVGHANVGKTSLLRTLTRDSHFGTVSDKPGTTRHVEVITFTFAKDQTILFYDTPGLEDSIALFDYIEQINQDNPKRDGVDKLNRFLQSPDAEYQFEQEAKVIRQLMLSDVAIYVIDIREPILAKYHDELAVLAYNNKPILAILNFTSATNQYENDWRELLSRVGIHAMICFDAVFPSMDGEERLYQTLKLLIEPAKPLLDTWQQTIIKQKEQRSKAANLIIAEALVDVTAFSEMAKNDIEIVVATMQEAVRKREIKAIDDLLALYQFSVSQQNEQYLPTIQGRFSSDLFNPAALKIMGIQLTKGMISGAAIGAGVDLAVGGITLGSAALIGATLGGLTQTVKHYGSRIKHRLSGYSKMSIDDVIICFLSLRLLQLKASLENRSHANSLPIILEKLDESLWKKGKLPKTLQMARSHNEWSTLNKRIKRNDESRQQAIIDVAKTLE